MPDNLNKLKANFAEARASADEQLKTLRRNQLTRAIREASKVRTLEYERLKRIMEAEMKKADEVFDHDCDAAWRDFDDFTTADEKKRTMDDPLPSPWRRKGLTENA
jgi:hypothetical protein